MSKTSKMCEIYCVCVGTGLMKKNPKKGTRWHPKSIPRNAVVVQEASGEEVAPWNTSTAGNPPLPVDNRTVYPQGSISLVNKIHALHVEDIEDRL